MEANLRINENFLFIGCLGQKSVLNSRPPNGLWSGANLSWICGPAFGQSKSQWFVPCIRQSSLRKKRNIVLSFLSIFAEFYYFSPEWSFSRNFCLDSTLLLNFFLFSTNLHKIFIIFCVARSRVASENATAEVGSSFAVLRSQMKTDVKYQHHFHKNLC